MEICRTPFYLVIIFLLVKIFNKKINNILTTDFLGKNHIRSIFISVFFIIISFCLPTIILIQFDFNFQPIEKVFESSIGFIIVSITEELIFRAFLFLSIFCLLRSVIFSALLVSLLFTFIHYNAIENITQFFWVFSASMLITYLYVYSKSIVSPIVFHFLLNLLSTNIIVPPNLHSILLVTQVVSMILCVLLLWFISSRNSFSLIGNK